MRDSFLCGAVLSGAVWAFVSGVAADEPRASADICESDVGAHYAIVEVGGFKDRIGRVRVELYPDTPEDFLAPGGKLRAEGKVFARVEIDVPRDGNARVCVALPQPNTYALAVLHDRNANGKLNPFFDGFGFPNNPALGFGKPDVTEVTFTSAGGPVVIPIILNYWNGIRARPLRH